MTAPIDVTAPVRLRAVDDIHAEPDVTVVLDTLAYDEISRELPEIYVDGDGDDDGDGDTSIAWGAAHASLQRAHFLQNVLLARDPIASKLSVCSLRDACTSMDGCVWDDARFFLDRLDGPYRVLRDRGVVDVRVSSGDGDGDGEEATATATATFRPMDLCWATLAKTLRCVLYTGPHTTAFARWTPILKDFARRISPPTPRFQSPPSTPFNSQLTPFNSTPTFARIERPSPQAAAAAETKTKKAPVVGRTS
jgi:hypothetical protein